MALLQPRAQLGRNGKHKNTPLGRTTWPFRNGSTMNVWISATQLRLQMTHQILQSLHRHWCPVVGGGGQSCCIFRATNLCSATLMLAATADGFCSSSSKCALARDKNAILHLLVDGHTLGLLSRRASMLRATRPLPNPIACLGLLDVRIHKWTQPCAPGVVL